ncbi:MAG: hypothetical protein RMX96_34675 [Nostoc sp. ChiSLP02]|nr:hypothetical protein [Nostoc sp. DedSLP05]MDZ8102453.1 hypothetical protein [Nostoc sp. DedSLP01]MDZ8189968.1 hypothetical protein [Nostoc sp. ChiSLP02]
MARTFKGLPAKKIINYFRGRVSRGRKKLDVGIENNQLAKVSINSMSDRCINYLIYIPHSQLTFPKQGEQRKQRRQRKKEK